MSLPAWIKATRRTTIVPQPAPHMSGAAGPGAQPPAAPSNPLDFPIECQKASQWCWAAVTVSVARFYSAASPWQQCKLAGEVLCRTCCGGSEECMADDHPSGCDQPYLVYHPLGVVGHLHEIRAAPIPLWAAPDTLTIQGEVDAERPVVCRIGWKDGGGHFVVLYGYDRSGTEPLVHVADPVNEENGVSTYNLREFTEAYRGRGVWTHTYTTRLQP
jgi:Papain-like cysteine protease AvrRpt2